MNIKITSAHLYYQIMNLEDAHVEVRGAAKAYIASLLEDDDDALQSDSLAAATPCVDGSKLVARLNTLAERWRSDQLIRHPVACTSAAMRFVAAQYAPVGLAPGCMLQNMTQAANSHEPLSAHVHAAHLWHTGGFALARNHACLYRQLLEHNGQYLPTIDSPTFAEQAELLPDSSNLGAYWLALSLSPGVYGPEILGAALFELQVPIAPAVEALLCADVATRGHPYLTARCDASRQAAQRHIERAIGEMFGEPASDPLVTAARIERGHRLSMHLQERWHAVIYVFLGGAVFQTSGRRRRGDAARAYGARRHIPVCERLSRDDRRGLRRQLDRTGVWPVRRGAGVHCVLRRKHDVERSAGDLCRERIGVQPLSGRTLLSTARHVAVLH